MKSHFLGIEPEVMENFGGFQQGDTKVRFVFLGKNDSVEYGE